MLHYDHGGSMDFLPEDFPKERIIWIFVTMCLAAIIIMLFTSTVMIRQKIAKMQTQITKEQLILEHMVRDIPALDEADIERLRDYGFENPLLEIKDDLKHHPEYIPYDAVLGGTMRLGKIHILSPRWVFAAFDDGHIGGDMLLEYRIIEGPDISWRVVASYLY